MVRRPHPDHGSNATEAARLIALTLLIERLQGRERMETTWMTSDQAVKYLALPSRKALYQAVRRGQIPSHRIGRRSLRFSKAEIDQWIARSRTVAI
jgi:excisionase family DNA binding protein